MKALSHGLIVVLLSTLLIALALQFLDPLGLYELSYNSWLLSQHVIPHETGYAYDTGEIRLLHGSIITNLADGLRFVPDSVETSPCRLVFLGDSVTYGMWVEDSETFANLAARDLKIEVWNVGRAGYNASQVARQLDYYSANAYVWLMIANDADLPFLPSRNTQSQLNAPQSWNEYRKWFLGLHPMQTHYNQDWQAYNQAFAYIASHENVLMFDYAHFEDDSRVIQIADYRPHVISQADPHPNALGHLQLYQEMKPYIAELVERNCN